VAFDVDVSWKSHVYAKLNVVTRHLGVKVPVTVRNATFDGTARIELTPLTETPPGWGALLISMPSIPKIGLRVEAVGSDITKVPWLKKEIMKGLQKSIENEFLWPKRLVLPSLTVPSNSKTVVPKSVLDGLATSDPLLTKETTVEEKEALKDHILKSKPDMTLLPSNLQVSLDDDNDDAVNGDTGIQAEAGIAIVKGKESISIVKKVNLFMKFIPHNKNHAKSKKKLDATPGNQASDGDQEVNVTEKTGDTETPSETGEVVVEDMQPGSTDKGKKKHANPFMKFMPHYKNHTTTKV